MDGDKPIRRVRIVGRDPRFKDHRVKTEVTVYDSGAILISDVEYGDDSVVYLYPEQVQALKMVLDRDETRRFEATLKNAQTPDAYISRRKNLDEAFQAARDSMTELDVVENDS
jgi:hypothetical protein